MEQWKDIEGYNGKYQVSNYGNVKSYYNSGNGRLLKKTERGNGYLCVNLSKSGNSRVRYIHRLVAEYFVPNPKSKPQVNHINEDKTDNNADNLEWVTIHENHLHSHKSGNLPNIGENHYSSKLTDNEAIDIINAYKLGVFTQKELADAYGISKSTVKDLLAGRNRGYLKIQETPRHRVDKKSQLQLS